MRRNQAADDAAVFNIPLQVEAGIEAFALCRPSLTVSIICNLVSSYLYDIFKGKSPPKVHLTLVFERTNETTHVRMDYSGDIEGLSKLPDLVRETLAK